MGGGLTWHFLFERWRSAASRRGSGNCFVLCEVKDAGVVAHAGGRGAPWHGPRSKQPAHTP
eukprot:356659-Chlamydomonas_euryale.AAC.3